jgi:hypothetical protein
MNMCGHFAEVGKRPVPARNTNYCVSPTFPPLGEGPVASKTTQAPAKYATAHCTSFRSFRRWRREGEGISSTSPKSVREMNAVSGDRDLGALRSPEAQSLVLVRTYYFN